MFELTSIKSFLRDTNSSVLSWILYKMLVFEEEEKFEKMVNVFESCTDQFRLFNNALVKQFVLGFTK